MNKKHHRAYKNMSAALTKAQVAVALMATCMEEMRSHLDIDAAAIESPKKGKISRKQALEEIVVRSKFKLPKGIKPGRNYVRG